ncbi:hypothetical protein F511_40195 [Dorcoceras hygrometricum]|uniref:Uncharacterized protein n=1 Tax=Dorcoceras hygrometricum TaxID=472368 RepID=A0A2Z7BLF7_9LAMI|nr:hypothetical protein F511_40195 [Dorcoceras hygrometricum]
MGMGVTIPELPTRLTTWHQMQNIAQPAAQLMRCGSYPLHSQWLTDPNREMRYGSYPLILNNILTKSDAYANRLEKVDVFAILPSFTQASKSSTKRSVSTRGVQRYHSHFNRIYLPPEIEEDKIR